MSESLLKLAIALCILLSLMNAAGSIYEYTPPYNVGECFSAPRQGVVAKIEHNYIFGKYSEVSAVSSTSAQSGPVAFLELRLPYYKPVECPK